MSLTAHQRPVLATAVLLLLASCAGATGGLQEESGCNTRISGVTTAPNGVDPMPGVTVFLARTPPPPLGTEIQCAPCTAPGEEKLDAVARTLSGPDGSFVLDHLPDPGPAGMTEIYLQKAGWRRRMQVKTTACHETGLSRGAAHLPSQRSEGEMPTMAVAVGDFDAIECVLRHIGIQPGEFTDPNGPGAVHLYENEQLTRGGAPGGVPLDGLLLDPRQLQRHQIVLLNCTDTAGIQPYLQDPLMRKNLVDYVTQGGRLYTTDWAYNFVAQQPEWSPFLCFEDGQSCAETGPHRFQGAAVGSPGRFNALVPIEGQNGSGQGPIDSPRALNDWLALPQLGLPGAGERLPITDLLPGWVLMKQTSSDVGHFPTTTWLRGRTNGADRPLTVTFDYPQPRACGRVLYSSHHTRGHLSAGAPFPSYCPPGDIIPQERVLEYLLFEVSSCVPILS